MGHARPVLPPAHRARSRGARKRQLAPECRARPPFQRQPQLPGALRKPPLRRVPPWSVTPGRVGAQFTKLRIPLSLQGLWKHEHGLSEADVIAGEKGCRRCRYRCHLRIIARTP